MARKKSSPSVDFAALATVDTSGVDMNTSDAIAQNADLTLGLASDELPVDDVAHATTEGPTELDLSDIIPGEQPITEPNPEIEALLQRIEDGIVEEVQATEAPIEPQVIPEAAPEEVQQAPADFKDLLGRITQDDANAMKLRAKSELEERERFEAIKNPSNGSMANTLKALHKTMTTDAAARAMLASNVDPAVINGSRHEGSRYNVYAVGKLADALNALGAENGKIGNAINNAVMRSLFKFRAAGLGFTAEHAKDAACAQRRVKEAAVKACLVRHTVSESTAATQASSTLTALQTMGIVTSSGGRNPTYTLTDSPQTRRLEELLAA